MAEPSSSSGNLRQLPGPNLPISASSSFRSALPADHRPSYDQISRRSNSDLNSRASFDLPNQHVAAFHNGSTAPDQSRRLSNSWSLRLDPEMKRKQRLASYKVMWFEGKVKSSVRKSFRWLKDKYLGMVNETEL